MYREDLGVHLGICSYKRPQNVALMTQLVGAATWYLSSYEDAADYIRAGLPPEQIVVVQEPDFTGCEAPLDLYTYKPATLQFKRNFAFKDAWDNGHTIALLSDDLRKVSWLEREEGGKKGKNGGFTEKPICFADGFRRFMQTWEEGDEYGTYDGFMLGGTMPAPNPFYRNLDSGVRTTLFVIGDFLVVKPCGWFLDPKFKVKDDYDYTLVHLIKYGGVYRNDDFMLYFLHGSNAGGLVDDRTAMLSKADIEALRAKWGDSITTHPSRENEILLRFKPYLYEHIMSEDAKARLPSAKVLGPLESAQRRYDRQKAYVEQRIRNIRAQSETCPMPSWLYENLERTIEQLKVSEERLYRFECELKALQTEERKKQTNV